MSTRNPTPVRVGMNATLRGRQFRVAGRVVMSMDDAGTTYYWNEFNLVSMDGIATTLVYEETEEGGQWRLFTFFEPQHPITAAQAAAQQVGDRIDLDGHLLRIELVDESRVCHIEGVAPEGVEVGDVAQYFNAGTGNDQIVASWTGDEIEFYRGEDLTTPEVAAAFGQPGARFGGPLLPSSTGLQSPPWAIGGVAAVIGIIAIAMLSGTCRSRARTGPTARTTAPAAPFTLGQGLSVGGARLHVREHRVTEIDRVHQRFTRHEYVLLDEGGKESLLACGQSPGASEWFLLQPFEPSPAMSPTEAAEVRQGSGIRIGDEPARVVDLFRCRHVRVESTALTGPAPGQVEFGFVAQSGTNWILARWTQDGIHFHRGPARVAKAFSGDPGPVPAP